MATDINSGTAAGLMLFLDYLVEKGYGSQAAVGPWKSASRKILRSMEGDGYEATDVTSIDPDDYLDRFENRERGSYKAESLRAYRSRFRNAIESYRAFLADGTIPTFRASRSATKPRPTGEGGSGDSQSKPEPKQAPRAKMVDYPFPLRSGEFAYVRLPARLEKADAERLAAYVRTLVFEPQPELPAGSGDSGDESEGTK